MKYSRSYANDYLRLKIYSNSRPICHLVENFLDFPRLLRCRPSLEVSFSLEETCQRKHDKLGLHLHQNLYKNNTISSILMMPHLRVKTDLQTRSVKASVHGFNRILQEQFIQHCVILPLYQIMARNGYFQVHASAIFSDNMCLLFSGPQHSGKSSIAMTLAQNGFSLMADDDCFLRLEEDQCRVYPFQTKIGLKKKFMDRHPEFRRYVVKNFQYGAKSRLTFKTMAMSRSGISCRAVVFPRYCASGKLKIRPLTKSEGLNKLIAASLCPYPDKDSRNMVWAFYRMAQKVSFFDLHYNDKQFIMIPELLRHLTKSSAAKP